MSGPENSNTDEVITETQDDSAIMDTAEVPTVDANNVVETPISGTDDPVEAEPPALQTQDAAPVSATEEAEPSHFDEFRDQLREFAELIGAEEAFDEFFDKNGEWIYELAVAIGLVEKDEDDHADNNEPPSPTTSDSTEVATLYTETIEKISDPDAPYNMIARPGRNVSTSGMIGRDQAGNYPEGFAETQLRFISNRGIKTIVTANGDGSAVEEMIQSAGLSDSMNHVSLNMSNRKPANASEASQVWNDASFLSQIKEFYQIYKTGNLLIHCTNGAHRSVCLSSIGFILDHPQLVAQSDEGTPTAQSILAGKNLTDNPDEWNNNYFQEFAPLLEYLVAHPEKIDEIRGDNSAPQTPTATDSAPVETVSLPTQSDQPAPAPAPAADSGPMQPAPEPEPEPTFETGPLPAQIDAATFNELLENGAPNAPMRATNSELTEDVVVHKGTIIKFQTGTIIDASALGFGAGRLERSLSGTLKDTPNPDAAPSSTSLEHRGAFGRRFPKDMYFAPDHDVTFPEGVKIQGHISAWKVN